VDRLRRKSPLGHPSPHAEREDIVCLSRKHLPVTHGRGDLPAYGNFGWNGPVDRLAGTCDLSAIRRTGALVLRAKDTICAAARQVTADDFAEFDYILAMDQANLKDLQRLAPKDYKGCLKLFLDFAPAAGAREVPDPYLGDYGGFQRVFNLLSEASRARRHRSTIVRRIACRPALTRISKCSTPLR
jgi:hypothetical protein